MNIRVYKKENLYFALKVIFTVIIFLAIIGNFSKLQDAESSIIGVIVIYGLMIWLFIAFQKLFLIGFLKGNGIEVNNVQFPEVFAAYKEMVEKLGIKKTPPLFIIQHGGMLNAFAIKFSGKYYIAVYSDVFELVSSDIEALKFIIGHELGHVKRNHQTKQFWTFLSSIIPFLTAAYSRSCEFTCDNIGSDLSDNGAVAGLLVLASGKKLYKCVDMQTYIENAAQRRSFAVWFTEICSTHPFLPARLLNVEKSME